MQIKELPEAIYQEVVDRRNLKERMFKAEQEWLADTVSLPEIVGFSQFKGSQRRNPPSGFTTITLRGGDLPEHVTDHMVYFFTGPDGEEPARFFLLGIIAGEEHNKVPIDTDLRTFAIDFEAVDTLIQYEAIGKQVIIF